MKNFFYPVVMALTVAELDDRLESLRASRRTAAEALLSMANDPSAQMSDIRAKKTSVEELDERIELMEAQKARMTGDAASRIGKKPSGRLSKKAAMGIFYKAAFGARMEGEGSGEGTGSGEGAGSGEESGTTEEAFEQLGVIPADNAVQGYGSRLLPKTMSRDLLLEPEITNPLRPFMTVTNVVGLELPKLDFAVDDDDFATADGESAKELAMNAGNIQFGRHKMHLIARVSETIIRTTPLNIEAAVTGGLQNAMARKELKVLFNDNPAEGEAEMSLYSSANNIKTVEGEDLLDAIIAAYGDLEDRYRPNARVCMSWSAYAGMIRSLANGSEALFGRKPEEIIGIPVVFCDKATTPVVGDFKYLCLNFDAAPWYDTDKDLAYGNRLFDLTALYDIKLRMKAAFRLAVVDNT